MANVPEENFTDVPSEIFKQFTAEKVGIYLQQSFTDFPAVSESAKISYHKAGLDNMIAQIQAWLVGGKIPSEPQIKIVRWPDGVWQMFKQLHFPEWFKRKFPVRWHTEQFVIQTNHYFVCPHLVTDPQSRHVQFMATGTDFARYGRHPDYR